MRSVSREAGRFVLGVHSVGATFLAIGRCIDILYNVLYSNSGNLSVADTKLSS